MALYYRRRALAHAGPSPGGRVEPRLPPELRLDAPPRPARSEVFDTGRKTIIDCAHVRVERLDTRPVLFSKVFKEFEDGRGQRYDYRYWAERENFFLREFLKKQSEFTHVVQARHLISENEAAKQVLTYDAGITVADWLRVRSRYADTGTLSHPFQRPEAFLRLIRACLVALKQLHAHRIVHCDIKEDNICIPYAPHPFPGEGGKIHLEFGQLRLIDFAFSVAHAIPLTQILVIDPDERAPYQSDLLVAALRADRRSGSPNAVQQLDCRVDLFSLGYMAEKISGAGLGSPASPGAGRALKEVHKLVQRLKAFGSARNMRSLPHDGLIAEIDRLLSRTAGAPGSLEFSVDGEWTAQEMAQGTAHARRFDRKTPLTPVALALPTPVSPPLAPAPRPPAGWSRVAAPLFIALAPVLAGAAVYLYLGQRGAGSLPPPGAQATQVEAPSPAQLPQPDVTADGKRIASLLRSDEDPVFRAAFGDLARLMKTSQPAAMGIAEAIAQEYGDALASPGPQPAKARALGRLVWMAGAGSTYAAARVAAFEKSYDEIKLTVAKSPWWARGEGPEPREAARWMENGVLLADMGDRPAMLDRAFAIGHGRGRGLDRVAAVEIYLKVMARSDGGDEASARIRRSAVRGLVALLHAIVEEKDSGAAQRALPSVTSGADAGPANLQYYAGLLNECVAQPANLDAARRWYLKAAADPAWKKTAEDKARLLGKWCPGSPG